jgi:acetoin utilization deacetylase AcuC-like enzyme
MSGRMKLVWSPSYEVDIGSHVFPTAKYRLVRERLLEGGPAAVPPSGPQACMMREEDFLSPLPASDEELARVHTREYLSKIREDRFSAAERLKLEVPFSPEAAAAMRLCCGGTILAARTALADGVAVHLGGGFHHAFAAHGEGFCLLNDVAVAAAALLAEGTVERALIVDLDVHHGNGTAAIFAGDERVFTFSMHQQNNYPAEKPPSDLDVGLPDGVGDERYLELLERHLFRALDLHDPDLVLYLAGADPYREDQLGGLGLTLEGLRRRDRSVLAACRERGVPVAIVLAGGYARHTGDTVAIHAATVDEAVAALAGKSS